MSLKARWYSDKFAKKRNKGFRGFPVATIAFYGPDDKRATKVSVGIIPNQGADPDPLEKWFSETIDVRTDPSVMEAVVRFIEQHGAKSVVALDRIIGCPHEEGIDYPEGEECPSVPTGLNGIGGRVRWSGESIPRPQAAGVSLAFLADQTKPRLSGFQSAAIPWRSEEQTKRKRISLHTRIKKRDLAKFLQHLT